MAKDGDWERILTDGHPPLRVMRHVFRTVPSSPRCKVCHNPFGGVGGRVFAMAGFKPWRKNPSVCTRCCNTMPPGGAEVDLAVLFADVRGSTKLGAGMDAAAYAELLNRFYAVATDVLVRHDAVIDKLIGDEVMALFIPGLAGKDYRQKAVEAGAELLREVPFLELGVGVNAGVAYCGNVGPADVTDFTALGDPVNLAARLQAEATAGQMLVACGVHDAVGEMFPSAVARDFILRGREAPLAAHVVDVAVQARV
jgi:adenylate cyclase